MAGITTAMLTSFKVEAFKAGHNFAATAAPTGDTTNSSVTVATVSSLTDLVVGAPLSGTGIAANTVLARFLSSTSIELSKAATASNTGITITSLGDTFKMALVKASMTGTYGASSTNYSDITGNSDEVSGTGYTAAGTALTNVSPTNPSGAVAITTFSNPSWTTASFTTTGAMIYNTSNRLGTTGRGVSVHDFGGSQTVTAGTFTVVMPTANAASAILRIQ